MKTMFRNIIYIVSMLVTVVLPVVGRAATMADTIPLQAEQTGSRTVALTWSAGDGITTVYRQYPGESQPVEIATSAENTWTDHHHRCVCGDTVRYSISRASDEGFAALLVSDNEPTAMANWGVVSVEDDQIRLQWHPSVDTDIMGYLICEGNPSVAIDTVFGRNNISYTYNGDIQTVHAFRLCAFDSCRQASALTDVCNNIVIGLTSEPCSRTVHASWNAYQNIPSGVGIYELWTSEDGEPYRRVSQLDANTTEVSFDVSESCMTLSAYVVVYSFDGSESAKSNRSSVQFSTTERPAYFYLRKVSASYDGRSVNIVAQTDPTFTGNDYRIYRSVGDRPAAVVAHIAPSVDGTLTWCDDGINPGDEACCYYLGVDDGCGRNEMRTARGYTLLPHLSVEGESMLLRWNEYGGWSGATQYQIISSPLDVDDWQYVGNTWATEYLLTEGGEGLRRYKILAFEGPDSEHQRGDSIQSVEVFHRPRTNIWMPNAFTPTETSNNYLRPQSQYINPQGYSFSVYNRYGIMIFSTTATDGYWDGRYKGIIQPNGAYLYKITYQQSDGTEQYLIGTVMLIR